MRLSTRNIVIRFPLRRSKATGNLWRLFIADHLSCHSRQGRIFGGRLGFINVTRRQSCRSEVDQRRQMEIEESLRRARGSFCPMKTHILSASRPVP